MTAMRSVYAITIHIDVDLTAAAILPGWPGSVNPHDPTDVDPPIDGMTFALQNAVHKAVSVLEDEMPTVADAHYIQIALQRIPTQEEEQEKW